MTHRFVCGDEEVSLDIEAEADGWRVHLPGGSVRRITARRLSEGLNEITCLTEAGSVERRYRAAAARTERGIEISVGGDVFVFRPADERRPAVARPASTGSLTAPMGGTVADVLVTAGQRVEAWQPLAVVEAMKVMATIDAPFAGTVTAVHATKGAQVRLGETLVVVEPDEEPHGEPHES